MSIGLSIQHAMRMCHIILSSAACPPVQYFSAVSHKRHGFRKKKVIENKVYFYFLHKFCLKHFSSQEVLSELWSKIDVGLRGKYRLFLSYFKETSIFWADFRKIFQYQMSWTPVQWEPSCSMWTKGQTDRHNRKFANAPKTCQHDSLCLSVIL